MAVSAQSPVTYSMAKHVVQGTVKDEHGSPVEGAALHIGREIVYTDRSGHFQARFSRHGPFSLTVVPDEFLSSFVYQVVSGPAEAKAETEDSATEIQIVVRIALPAKPVAGSVSSAASH
jgi:hypothetical protein